MKSYKVLFLPSGREIEAEEGENLLQAAIRSNIYINAECGGEGVCGKCKVLIESGKVTPILTSTLTQSDAKNGFRLACQSEVKDNLVVRVIEQREEEKPERFQIERSLAKNWSVSPCVSKIFLDVPTPSLDENVNDLSRILKALKNKKNWEEFSIDLPFAQKIPHVLREKEFEVTLTLLTLTHPPKIINIEPGDTSDKLFGIAVDVGTTSVHGELLNLRDGSLLAYSSEYNKQISLGEDIISRIIFSNRNDGLKSLQQSVVKTINQIIQDLVKEGGVKEEEISLIVVAGNTTMIHLLLGIPPKYIREVPYTPVVTSMPPIPASQIGLKLPNHTHLYCVPCVASYIGGDITAGILSSGIFQREELTLYIDVGTNGEIVLGNKEWLLSASCSAGPAFEGTTITCGMRAVKGAIEKVGINKESGEPTFEVIGGGAPNGICGSGLIDLVAGLLETGGIGRNGKYNLGVGWKRIREKDGRAEYVVAWNSEGGGEKEIVLTEADIMELMRAKGAIYAGISLLLEYANMDFSSIERVIIAGNFGRSLNIERAITIGLLPELPIEKFTFIGNGALGGARLIALSEEMLKEANRIARMMTNVELSDNPRFMEEYMQALFLPHTDMEKEFPEVGKRLVKKR
jgi:uncharacterized 2Fe-2S/4Fe-4S cluster protein (DUF4445 family)